MQKGWLVALVILTLLVPSVLAECYKINACDGDYETRQLESIADARLYFLSMNDRFQDNLPTPEAYPATLFYASQPDTASLASQTLGKELAAQTLDVDAHESALYLAWTLEKYGAVLSQSVLTDATSALDAYVFNSSKDGEPLENRFLRTVAIYLGNEGSNKDEFVIPGLRNEGDGGWLTLENNPARLAKIVTALAALYDAAPDEDVRKLAEMNLDLIFTRFAASSVGGAWVSPTAGNTLSTIDTLRTPWYGWSFLLFDDAGKGHTVEPSMIVSDYCAHVVTRTINNQGSRLFDKTNTGAALATVVTLDYALGAARDDGVIFNPSDGYITKVRAHFADYKHFIELNSRTCPEVVDDQQTDNTKAFLINERVVLGRLDPFDTVCGEPHALLGVGAELSPIYDATVLYGVVVKFEDNYTILRFLEPIQQSTAITRYANRSNSLPSWLLEDGGDVIFPLGTAANRGVFSLEIASDDFVREATDEDVCDQAPIDCVAQSAAGNTSLDYVGGVITYVSVDTDGNPITYTYQPGGEAHAKGVRISTAEHSLRRTDKLAGGSYLAKTGNVWLMTAQYGSQNAAVTFDFAATTPETMKVVTNDYSTYICEDDTSTISADSDFNQLSFAAASLLDVYADDDHVLDCAPGTNAFPNEKLYPSITGACVLSSDDKRIVALAASGNISEALSGLNLYFPFFGNANFNFTNLHMCDNAWAETFKDSEGVIINDYSYCGQIVVTDGGAGLISHNPLYVWVNGGHNILIIGTDRNPFTNGWWSELIGDWFTNLFSAGMEQGPDSANVPQFTAAYSLKDGGKEIRAALHANSQAELIAEKLEQSLALIADKPGSTYAAAGTTQHILFSSASTGKGSDWAMFTRALRLHGNGNPLNFVATCNGRVITHLPECTTPSATHEPCPDDPERYVVCTPDCLLDYAACDECHDLDSDGEYYCGDPETGDCLDADPDFYSILNNDGNRVLCSDVPPLSSECDEPPWSKCPQCVRHSDPHATPPILINNPCDGVSNDCISVEHCDPAGSGDPVAVHTCENLTGVTSCAYICDLPPPCPYNCTSDEDCDECMILGCRPDVSCDPVDDCGARTECASTSECAAGQECRAGCCYPPPTGGGTVGSCFSARTLVTMADGTTKAIAAVAIGDVLLVFDEENGVLTTDVVTETLEHPGEHKMLLLNGHLEVTRRHQLLSSRGWLAAEELEIGDSIRSAEGWVGITSSTPFFYTEAVYNLHLSTHHNYLAGGLIVHNINKN